MSSDGFFSIIKEMGCRFCLKAGGHLKSFTPNTQNRERIDKCQLKYFPTY